jgi:transcription-repair coupling factor (superfamily II helicase)
VELAPVSEVILDEARSRRFRQNYRIEFGAAGTDDPLYEAVSAGRKHAGMEHWLAVLPRAAGDAVRLPAQGDGDAGRSGRARAGGAMGAVADAYDARRTAMRERGRMDSVYKPAPPQLLYLDEAAWEAAVGDRRVLQFNPLKQPTGPGVIDAGGKIGRDFAPERQNEKLSLFGALAAHVKARLARGQWCWRATRRLAERMENLLEDEETGETIPVTDFSRVGRSGIHLAVWPLEHGLRGAGAYGDLGAGRAGRPADPADAQEEAADNFLTEVNALTPGDLVVHVDHGVGRYLGLEVLRALGAAHECLRWNTRRTRSSTCRSRTSSFCPLRARGGLLDKLGAGPGRRGRRGSRSGSSLRPSG